MELKGIIFEVIIADINKSSKIKKLKGNKHHLHERNFYHTLFFWFLK